MSAPHSHDYGPTDAGTSRSAVTGEPAAADPTAPATHERDSGSREAAREATARAGDRAREVADEAMHETKHVALQAKERLREQADEQAHQVGEALERLAEQLEALADGRVHEAGDLVGYTRDVAGRARTLATRMEHLGVDGMARELSDYARRRPGRFLLGAAAAGVIVGRLGRNLRSSNGQAGDQQGITGSAERHGGQTRDRRLESSAGGHALPPETDAAEQEARQAMRGGVHDV